MESIRHGEIGLYNIALIGFGRWGKTLLPYLEEFFNVRLIFGRSVEKRGKFTDSLSDIFSSDIGAVVVATPIGTHYEVARQALMHDKHVFCEKPLAVDPSLARKLDFVATQKGLHLITDYTYVFSRRLWEVQKNIIHKKKMGGLRSVKLRMERKLRKNKFGVYWVLASHMLAVLDMFTDIVSLEFDKTDLVSQERSIISFTGDIKGEIFVDSNSLTKKTEASFFGDLGKIDCTQLHEEDDLTYAMDYFKNVLDGRVENKANLIRAISVTDVLWKLGGTQCI